MTLTTWTNHAGRTHLVVAGSTTWCGKLLPRGARTLSHRCVGERLPCDCATCTRAWQARPKVRRR